MGVVRLLLLPASATESPKMIRAGTRGSAQAAAKTNTRMLKKARSSLEIPICFCMFQQWKTHWPNTEGIWKKRLGWVNEKWRGQVGGNLRRTSSTYISRFMKVALRFKKRYKAAIFWCRDLVVSMNLSTFWESISVQNKSWYTKCSNTSGGTMKNIFSLLILWQVV